MSEIVLKASHREPGQKNAKALRRADQIPGVYYANGQDPIHFSVPKLSLRDVIYTAEAKVVSLQVEGQAKKAAILKAVTFDPITDYITHFDLIGISAGHKMMVEIPLHLVGDSQGVKDGGVLEQTLLRAHVNVDPTKMPEHIDVDITNLVIGNSIHIGELNIPGIEFEDRPDAVIVACHAPKTSDGTESEEAAEQPVVATEEETE